MSGTIMEPGRIRMKDGSRSHFAEDMKTILSQIDKMLNIYGELVKHGCHPPMIVDGHRPDIESLMANIKDRDDVDD